MSRTHQSEVVTCPVVEVQVQGALDLTTVERTREQLCEALDLKPSCLVVDLSGCTFFDATGISMLLDMHRRAWRQHGTMELRGCSDRHLRLLALMGLIDVFDTGVARPVAIGAGRGRD